MSSYTKMADWNKVIFQLSDIKIILHLKEHHGVRYSELLRNVVDSRSTLARSLTYLQETELVTRRVKNTRPVQTEYELTERGREVAELLLELRMKLYAQG